MGARDFPEGIFLDFAEPLSSLSIFDALLVYSKRISLLYLTAISYYLIPSSPPQTSFLFSCLPHSTQPPPRPLHNPTPHSFRLPHPMLLLSILQNPTQSRGADFEDLQVRIGIIVDTCNTYQRRIRIMQNITVFIFM